MTRLRWLLVGLLAASTVLFAVGVVAERSTVDEHVETALEQRESAEQATGGHDEAGEGGAGESVEETENRGRTG